MSILSGFIKTIKYRLTADGYKWQSEKTSSQTVVMGNGTDNTDTLEARLGSIKGITSSLSSTDDGYALSASAGKDLQDQVTENKNNINTLNTNLGTYDYFEGTVSTAFAKINGKVELSLYKNLLLILNNSNGCCIATTSIPVPILKSYYNSNTKILRAACPGTSDYYVADIYYDKESDSIYGKASSGCNLQIYLQK